MAKFAASIRQGSIVLPATMSSAVSLGPSLKYCHCPHKQLSSPLGYSLERRLQQGREFNFSYHTLLHSIVNGIRSSDQRNTNYRTLQGGALLWRSGPRACAGSTGTAKRGYADSARNSRGFLSNMRKPSNDVSGDPAPIPVVKTLYPKKDKGNIHGRAQKLVKMVKNLSYVKEEIYAALDEWAAWNMDFPILATKSALSTLKAQGEWKRILQVSKWMLSKGQGKSVGTFALMLEALHYLDRLEEMDEMWLRIIDEGAISVPRYMYAHMMKWHAAASRHEKVVEVFGTLDAMKIHPDEEMMACILSSLHELGAPQTAEELQQKYSVQRMESRMQKGKKVQVKVFVASGGSTDKL